METKKSLILITVIIFFNFFGCATQKKQAAPSEEPAQEQVLSVPSEESGEEKTSQDKYGPQAPAKRSVVLVLGPGLARGFAFAGVLRELEKNGIGVSAIVATEIGALIGAMYADSSNLNEFEWKLLKLKKRSFERPKMSLSRVFNQRNNGKDLLENLSEIFSNKKISQTQIPIRIGVSRVGSSGSEFPLEGEIKDWIRASMAVDSLYTEYQVQDLRLKSPLPEEAFPILEAKELEKGPVIFVDVYSELSLPSDSSDEKSYVDEIEKSLKNKKDAESYADLIITPKLSDIRYFDFDKKKTIEYRGRAAVQSEIKRIKSLVDGQ